MGKKRAESISRTNTLDFLLSVLDYNTYVAGKGQQMKLPSTARVCLRTEYFPRAEVGII